MFSVHSDGTQEEISAIVSILASFLLFFLVPPVVCVKSFPYDGSIFPYPGNGQPLVQRYLR